MAGANIYSCENETVCICRVERDSLHLSSIFYSLFPLPNETVLHHSIVLEGCGNIDADIFDRGPYLTEKEKNRDSIFSRKKVRNVEPWRPEIGIVEYIVVLHVITSTVPLTLLF